MGVGFPMVFLLCWPMACVVWLVAWGWVWDGCGGLAGSCGEMDRWISPLKVVGVLVGGVGVGFPMGCPLCWSIACVVWLVAWGWVWDGFACLAGSCGLEMDHWISPLEVVGALVGWCGHGVS